MAYIERLKTHVEWFWIPHHAISCESLVTKRGLVDEIIKNRVRHRIGVLACMARKITFRSPKAGLEYLRWRCMVHWIRLLHWVQKQITPPGRTASRVYHFALCSTSENLILEVGSPGAQRHEWARFLSDFEEAETYPYLSSLKACSKQGNAKHSIFSSRDQRTDERRLPNDTSTAKLEAYFDKCKRLSYTFTIQILHHIGNNAVKYHQRWWRNEKQ